MDRRIKKNQAAITKAFIDLLAEKDFEKITINEIAERADVNRGTVYSHYMDKYDLLDKCIEAKFTLLLEYCYTDDGESYPSKTSLLRTLEHMEDDESFYRNLITNKSFPSFRNHLQQLLNTQIKNQVPDHYVSLNGVSTDIVVQFYSSAIVGVIEWWFTHTVRYSAKEMTEQLWALLESNRIIPFS
ncbi:DNA-binding transcriptional regulator EnvR [compost metagenome]